MAKVSIIVCDLCKRVVENIEAQLVIRSSKDSNKKADVCLFCSDDLLSKINSKVDFNKPLEAKGDAKLVPSANKTPLAKPSKEPGCTHDRMSFDAEKGLAKCRECGHEEKA